jgi:Domain of unknown function (DUF4129)
MAGGRRPWLGLLLALLTSTVTLATSRQEALDAIDSCVQRLNPDVDTGYDRIVARCPNLPRRLGETGLSVWLPRDWQRPRNDLSAGGLRELRALLARELTPTPRQSSAPSVRLVPAVLASLERADPERSGWWARTKMWLRDIFEAPAAAADEGWLNRMIGRSGLSQTVIELVSYVALLLVLVLAVAIVVNELRVSSVWGRMRRRPASPGDSPGHPRRPLLSWEEVQTAPPQQRLGLLLELLVARMAEGGDLRLPRGLTARELARAAQLALPEDRELLAALAEASERVRFSNSAVPGEVTARALEGGRRLLERVSARAQTGAL